MQGARWREDRARLGARGDGEGQAGGGDHLRGEGAADGRGSDPARIRDTNALGGQHGALHFGRRAGIERDARERRANGLRAVDLAKIVM